jgi:hypothetical protein
MQYCSTAVHRQAMHSMDRGVQAGQGRQRDAISAAWQKWAFWRECNGEVQQYGHSQVQKEYYH